MIITICLLLVIIIFILWRWDISDRSAYRLRDELESLRMYRNYVNGRNLRNYVNGRNRTHPPSSPVLEKKVMKSEQKISQTFLDNKAFYILHKNYVKDLITRV